MGAIGVLNNILVIYVSFQIIKIWLFGAEFSGKLGVLVLAMMAMSAIFILQRIGIFPSHK